VTSLAPTNVQRPRSLRLAVALHPDVLPLLGLTVLSAALVALTWGTWGQLDNDTGHDFGAAARVAHGDLPYVDFTYWYGPLAPFALGLAARLGGSGLAPMIGSGLVVSVAIVLATYALGRAHAGRIGGFLAAALTAPPAFAPNQFSFVLPHTSSATYGILSLLCLLLALTRGGRALALAGLCTGLATLTKPEFALAAFAASAAWLVARALNGRLRRRELLAVAGPAIAVPAAVYGTFLTAVPLHRLLFENLDPRGFLAAAGNTMLKARAPLTADSFLQLGLRLALYAAGVAVLVLVARALGARRLPPAVFALAIAGAAAATILDPESVRHALKLAWAWIPAGAAIAAAAHPVSRYRGAGEERLAAAVALTVLAGTTYAAFYAYSFQPQMAIYAVPLAAVFLARIHLVELARFRGAAALGAAWLVLLAAAGTGLTINDAHAEPASVHGPGGTLRTTARDATTYQGAIDSIVRLTRTDEPILVAPQNSWLYAVTARTNPLPQLSLLPGALDANGERAAIATLTRDRVRVAVIDRRAYLAYGHGSFGASFDRALDRWVRSNFKRNDVFQAGGTDAPWLEVWTRRRR
jgi:hypothetical protein